jgi:hypothetical protein
MVDNIAATLDPGGLACAHLVPMPGTRGEVAHAVGDWEFQVIAP